VTTRPSREQFTAAYLNLSLTVDDIALRFRVSDTTVKSWARRFNLPPRKTGGWRGNKPAPRIVLKAEENHCEPVNDGPAWGDPTPEQIAELAAYCRARNILTMQTMQDEHCEHRQAGRCWRCRRGLT
jgi:transposase